MARQGSTHRPADPYACNELTASPHLCAHLAIASPSRCLTLIASVDHAAHTIAALVLPLAAKTARVKLMSKLGGSDALTAQVDYDTNDRAATLEVGYDHKLEDGRDISAKIKPNAREVDIDYVDNKFEQGATWTASASVPLEKTGGSNMLDAAKLTLKRSWKW